MSLINRLTTWTLNQLLTSSALNGEFNNIVNTLNNLDSATTAWTNVKAGTITGTGTATVPTINASTTYQKGGFTVVCPLQVVYVSETAVDTTTSSTFTSTSLAGTMTLQSTSSKVLVMMSGILQAGSASAQLTVFRASNLLSTNGAFRVPASTQMPCSLVFLDSPGATGSTTWTVKYLSNGGTAQFGETNYTMNLVLVELL